MRPLTDEMPKALVPYKGMPMLERVIGRLLGSGAEQIVVNVHHMADQVEDFLESKDYFGGRTVVSDERALLMDTGGGVLKAREYLSGGGPFILHNVDVHTGLDIKKMYDHHLQGNSLVTIAVNRRPARRSFLFGPGRRLCGWQNNKTGERIIVKPHREQLEELANSCVYIISQEFFNLAGRRGVSSLTDILLELAPAHEITGYVHDDYWYDLGDYEHYRMAGGEAEP